MKKILVIGNVNTELLDMGRYIGRDFIVHTSADNTVMAGNMLKLIQPELILVQLNGFHEESTPIFEEIAKNYGSTPVMCLGTEDDILPFAIWLARPEIMLKTGDVSHEEILLAICEKLDVEPGSGRKSVLLVDDDAVLLRTMNNLLKEDYNVKMAVSGEKALEMMQEKMPDIVFLDYNMPGFDGKETLERIREMPGGEEVPVVFLTGVGDRPHIEAILNLHPAGYLLKPAGKDMIYEILKKYM